MASEVDKLLEDVGFQPGASVPSATPDVMPQTPAKEPWAVQIKKPDETVYKLGVAPETKKQSFVEYVSSDPKTRQSLSEFISVNNQRAFDGAVPLDKLPGGNDFYKSTTGWVTNLYSPERLNQIKNSGKIGAVEAWNMLNKWELAPYLNGASLAEDVKAFSIMKRLKESPDSVTPEDKDYAYKFLDEMAQLEIRGLSFRGGLVYYGLRMPAYAIEFAGALSAVGGLATITRESTELALKQGVKSSAKLLAKGSVEMLTKGTKAAFTPTVKILGKTAPNLALLARPAKTIMDNHLNDSIVITDKGQALFKEAEINPAKAVFKALGSHWAETVSETAGGTVLKPFAHVAGNAVGRVIKMPKGFMAGLNKLAETSTGKKFFDLVQKSGYDGMLEEIGEERLGGFLRATLNLEEKGYSFDAYMEQILPNSVDDFLLELGMIGIYQGTSYAGAYLGTKLAKGTPEQIQKTVSNIQSISELEKDKMVNSIRQIETEKDVQEYTQKIQDFKDMVGENVPRETLDANIAIWDNMINVLANKTGKTRSELADELPIVKSMKQGELQGLFQSKQIDDSNNLIAMHNLSEDNLKHVVKMGGLAAPSLSIGKKEHPLEGFGEITLIGNTDLIKPSQTTKVFGADVYSKRYPEVNYKIDIPKSVVDELNTISKEIVGGGGSGYLSKDELERNGIEFLYDSPEIQYKFLKEKNIDVKLKTKKAKLYYLKLVPEFKELITDKYMMPYELIEKKEFKPLFKKFIEKEKGEFVRDEIADGKTEKEAIKEANKVLDDEFYYEDGIPKQSIVRRIIEEYGAIEDKGKPDYYENKSILRNAVAKYQEFQSWVDKTYSGIIKGEKIFKGYTPSGDRKYAPHTLENVVKELIKEIRDAEGFSYGLGNLRATVAKQYKTIAEIQNDRDKIISKEDFEEVKIETDKLFEDILEEANKNYIHKKEYGVSDTFVNVLKDAIKTKSDIKTELDKYGFPAMDIEKIELLLNTISKMPTEYFEVKVKRAVNLNEFVGAVVPYNVSKKTLDILNENNIEYMKVGREEKRSEAIDRFSKLLNKKYGNVLFQGAKGAFNAKNNIIALFETADRSTFLHESAHAFFEMYLKHLPTELDTVMKWVGFEGKKIEDLTDKQYVKLQESFASGFEIYLREGKAPSMKLADAFESFKDWLTKIYDSVQSLIQTAGLRIKLSDDIKNFYDEMLAVPADRVAKIDERTPEEIDKERDLTLFQQAKKKLEEVRQKQKELTSKYKKGFEAELKALEQEIPTLEDMLRNLNIETSPDFRFLVKIQNAKTIEEQKKVLKDIYKVKERYWEGQQKTILDDKIKDMLKKTKPKAQAGVTKGKYEYEDNKFFEELREVYKLKKEDAKNMLSLELEKEDAGADFLEGIDEDQVAQTKLKRLLLSVKANGKRESSVELFEETYSALQNAIAIAKESKDEKDFIEKINLSDKKNSVLEAIKVMKFKGDRDNASTKALNIYRVMFADLYGQLNSIAGKDVAEEYALDVKEKDKQSELESFRDEMYLDIQNILNVKDKYEVEKYFDKLNKKEFKLFEIGRLKGKDITRWEIIDIYNSIKNEKTREHYYKYYGQEQVDSLVSNLTDREIAIANYLQERVQEMYGIVNQIHIKQFGIDLGRVENYWPRKSEQSEKEPYQEYRQATQISSAQKARAEGAIPLPQNAYLVASKHFDNAIHQKNLFDVWYNARKVFGSRRVRTAIEDKYGADVHRKLIESIDDVSFNSNNVVLDKASQIVMKALSNWTGAKILLNASLVPKQFIGAFNFLEQVPAQHFTKYFIEGLLNPKKTIDYMFEKSKYVPARFKQGADDIMQNVMKNGGNVAKSRKFTDYMSFFIRTGDAGAVVFGGYAHVKYLMDVKGMSEAEAIQEFEKQTIRTQQAGFKTSLAGYQKIPGMKFFTAFKNAQTQMMRRVVNAFIQYQQGDIDKKQLAKVFTLYVIVQPALFGMVSVAWREIVMGKGGDDEDRYLDAAFENIFTNALAPVPLVADSSGNIYKTISASLKGETVPFWAKQTSTPLITDLNKLTYTTSGIVGNLLTGEDPDFEDVLKMLELGAEIGYGLPVGNVVRQIQGILRLE